MQLLILKFKLLYYYFILIFYLYNSRYKINLKVTFYSTSFVP